MIDESFAYDPQDEKSIVREHNQSLQEEPDFEMDRRVSGPTFADSQARLARIIDALTTLAERNGQ